MAPEEGESNKREKEQVGLRLGLLN